MEVALDDVDAMVASGELVDARPSSACSWPADALAPADGDAGRRRPTTDGTGRGTDRVDVADGRPR